MVESEGESEEEEEEEEEEDVLNTRARHEEEVGRVHVLRPKGEAREEDGQSAYTHLSPSLQSFSTPLSVASMLPAAPAWQSTLALC